MSFLDFFYRKEECFNIDVSIQNGYPLIDNNKTSILRLKSNKTFGLNHPPVIQADPFLFVYNDKLHLFFEDLLYKKGKGVIKMMSTSDLAHWSQPIEITHEPETHFSYPYVFEDNGNVYMLPETGCDKNIRLYKAVNNDLTNFLPYKVIYEEKRNIDNVEFVCADSIIYKKEDIYYLFTSYKTDKSYYLELYTSDKLDGAYISHPNNPIVRSDKYGRCAGSLLDINGHLYRFAQDCEHTYGGQVHLLEIDELSIENYREHLVYENVLPQEQEFYRLGGHQVNFADYKGHIVVATDGKEDGYFYLERIRLIVSKFINYIKF